MKRKCLTETPRSSILKGWMRKPTREKPGGKKSRTRRNFENRLDGPENKNLRKRVWVRGRNYLHPIFLTQLPSKF